MALSSSGEGGGLVIEVVIEVHAIDVVVARHLHHGLDDRASRLGMPGSITKRSEAGDPLRLSLVHAGGAPRCHAVQLFDRGGRTIHRDAVRVEPGMQLQVAPMGSLDDERQRIEPWVLPRVPVR